MSVSSIYPPHSYEPLSTVDGHVERFGEFFGELKRRWVKVERLQEYVEADFEGYREFKRGNFEDAQRLVREMVKSQSDVYEHARAHNIEMTRVRIYDLPLSPYLRHYEIAAYEADVECGENIFFVNSATIMDLLHTTGISDFVVFDDERVVCLLYADDGRLQEARLVESPTDVADFQTVVDQLVANAQPMHLDPAYLALAGGQQ